MSLESVHADEGKSEFIRYDWNAKFAAKFDKAPLAPLTLENHRSSEYVWAHLYVQSEIMQQMYEENMSDKSETEPFEEWAGEEWITNFSQEFNEAFKIMILKYPEQLLELFRKDFVGMVKDTKALLEYVCNIEHTTEENLHMPHSDSSREVILPEIDSVFRHHLDFLNNVLDHEEEIVDEVEAHLAQVSR